MEIRYPRVTHLVSGRSYIGLGQKKRWSIPFSPTLSRTARSAQTDDEIGIPRVECDFSSLHLCRPFVVSYFVLYTVAM